VLVIEPAPDGCAASLGTDTGKTEEMLFMLDAMQATCQRRVLHPERSARIRTTARSAAAGKPFAQECEPLRSLVAIALLTTFPVLNFFGAKAFDRAAEGLRFDALLAP